MKSLKEYITESINKISESLTSASVDTYLSSICHAELQKTQLEDMLSSLDMKDLKTINSHLSKTDSKNYLAYEVSSDSFISDSNKESIAKKIADYLLKFRTAG